MPELLSDPLPVFGWWPLDIAANAVIGVTFFTISMLVAFPLWRMRQFRTNKLAAAAAAVFLCAGVGRGMQVLHLSGMASGRTAGAAFQSLESSQAVWDLLTALVAVSYLILRKRQARLLDSAPLFDDLAHVQHVTELEALRVQRAARAAAEAQRDASAAMLTSIIANTQSAIYVKDLHGRYLVANPAMLQILGRPEAEVLGSSDPGDAVGMAALLGPDDTAGEDDPSRRQAWIDDFPDGRHFYDSVTFPLVDAHGARYATCGVSLDVTTQTRALAAADEARDRAVASAAAKTTFLATMSHEIRTPLNAVIGLTDLLAETQLDDGQREFVDTVRSSGEALLAILNDILDFSQIESGELALESAPFNLRDEVESCLDLVVMTTTAKRLELICHVDDSCPVRVVGDAIRLRQMLANLLSNAVKFTDEGEVSVSVTASPHPEGRWQVEMIVTDTGIGITPDGLDRVFNSFSQVDGSSTRTHGGTGLGLAITQSLANAMQGEATIVSTPRIGTSVTVTLVLDACLEPPGAGTSPAGHAEALAGRSVLVVDDNLTSLRVLAHQLEGLGMTCTPAASASQALTLVAAELSYDLALIDTDMPDMDGVELSAALRNGPLSGNSPHVLLTRMGTHPDNPLHSYAGFLAKPIKAAALREAVTAALDVRPHPEGDLSREARTRPEGTQPLRILLAEDNPVNQRVAQLILKKLGQSVDVVGNGSEAVRAVQTQVYDVVLMDIQMPYMDGITATRLIRANRQEHQPRIVAITASAQAEDRAACLAAGMDRYLSKPMRARELEEILDDIRADLRRPGSQPTVVTAPVRAVADDFSPGVEVAVFADLMTVSDNREGTLREELIATYLADTSEQLERLVTAARECDNAAAADIAHTLRLSSALIGSQSLAGLLERTATAARTQPADLPALTQLVMIEYARVTEALHDMRLERPIALRPEAVPQTPPAASPE